MHYDEISGLVDYATREQVIDYAASKAEDGMVFVELGCYLGSTLCRLATKIKERGINVTIYGIDNWLCHNISDKSISYSNLNDKNEIYSKFLDNIDNCGLNGLIRPIVFDTTEAAAMFADKSVDYIFFDANHGFGLKEELLSWLPKLKDKSLAVVHDWPNKLIHDIVVEVCSWYESTGDGNSVWIRKTL